VALLALATVVAGVLLARKPPRQASTAVRVDSASGLSASPASQAPSPAAVEAAPAAISLTELARELQARQSTTTTRPRTTTTTRKQAASATTTTSRQSTATTATPRTGPPPPATSTTAGPLTPLTTLVEAIVPPAASAVSSALTRSDSGVASWFNAPDATCAHRTLPMGTMVKVTRISNGAAATCKVNDRGPTVATGRLIDLSLDTFEKLAAKEAGLIDVRIEW
jgi:rare lipoprotein A